MSAHLLLPTDALKAVTGRWWDDPALFAKTSHPSRDASCASLRFGDVVLDLDTTYEPLLDDFRDTYGDCVMAEGERTGPVRIACSAQIIEGQSLVALRFQIPDGLPHLTDIAMGALRPRADQQHFSAHNLDRPGWRWIANAHDENAPLLSADEDVAIVDVRIAPSEFLVNFIVGLAQLAQPSILFVHGGGLSIAGRGALLVGGSGRGKSTTTVALASRGHALLGDETVGLRADPAEILSFRRTLKLRPGPRANAVVDRLHTIPHGIRIDAQGVECDWIKPGALFPGPTLQSAPMGDVFFLRRFSDHATVEPFVPSLDQLEELQALTMTLSAVVSWPFSAAHRLVRFLRVIDLFAKCRCYFLDLGTPDETAALIERTVLNNATERA
jgi:hypothetical protein